MTAEDVDRLRRPWAYPDLPAIDPGEIRLFPRASRARDTLGEWRWRAVDAWAVLRGRVEVQ